jgi:hypothetical protein
VSRQADGNGHQHIGDDSNAIGITAIGYKYYLAFYNKKSRWGTTSGNKEPGYLLKPVRLMRVSEY